MTPAELKVARKTLGLTQTQCAKIVGLTHHMISKCERGEYPVPPYVETILSLALELASVRRSLGIERVSASTDLT